MAEESIADKTQASHPAVYANLGLQAAYQIEATAIGLRDFALAHPEELDLFVLSVTNRVRALAGVLMSLSQGMGCPHDVLTVWGDTVDSFCASLPEGDLGSRLPGQADEVAA